MFGSIELTGMIEALFVSIPESVGLLAFGLGLMTAAATGIMGFAPMIPYSAGNSRPVSPYLLPRRPVKT